MVKKRFASIAAVLVALVMAVWAAPPAHAQITTNSTADIVVSGLPADDPARVVEAYKIIDVDYDYNVQQPLDPEYHWVDAAAEVLKANDTYKEYVGAENAVADFNDALETPNGEDGSKEENALYQFLAEKIKGGQCGVTAEDGLTKRGMGVYLVLVKSGAYIYKPMVAQLVPSYDEASNSYSLKDGAVQPKYSKPAITKTVRPANQPYAGVEKHCIGAPLYGDVKFDIVIDLPDYPNNMSSYDFKLYLEDQMDEMLEFYGGSVDVGNIQIYMTPHGEQERKATNSELEIFALSCDGAPSKTISFSASMRDTTANSLDRYDKIRFEILATLSEAAKPAAKYTNTATLKYVTDPYSNESAANSQNSVSDSASVVTYGIRVNKVDAQGKALAGAKFKLSNNEAGTEFFDVNKLGNGSYAAKKYYGSTGTELETDANGKLEISALPLGEYWLFETKAPDGYNKLAKPVKITVRDSQGSDEVADGTVDPIEGEGTTADGAWTCIQVANRKGFMLPQTGDMGITMFVAAGVVLVGAGGLLYMRNKKRAANE